MPASAAAAASSASAASGASAASSVDLSMRWMAGAVSQLFAPLNSAAGPSEYVRAHMRDNMWRAYRRAARLAPSSMGGTTAAASSASSAAASAANAAVDAFEYKFVRIRSEDGEKLYPVAVVVSSPAVSSASDDDGAAARKRARIGAVDEHKSAVNHHRDDATMEERSGGNTSSSGGAGGEVAALQARVHDLQRELAAARAASSPLCVRCRYRGSSVVLLRCGHTPWCETCTLHEIQRLSKRATVPLLKAGAFLSLQPHEVIICPLEFCKVTNSSVIRPTQ